MYKNRRRTTMRALVKYGNKDGEVRIADVPMPEIGPDDILLQTKAVGICGWDIEMWRHKMANPVTVPVIQGHEFCGVIDKVGANITDWKVGDRVVSETGAEICGSCPQCLTGNYQLCSKRKGFGYGVDGAFTDYVKVRRGCLHHLPDNVDFDYGCLTEPACVAYQALVVLSDVRPGTPVLIIGPGPVGLFALQIAKACSAGPVMVAGVDKDAPRFEVAKQLGADRIINVMKQDPKEVVMEMTKGLGCPLVVDAAGNSKALELAVFAVARQGQITKIGWGPKPVDFSLDPLLSKAARIQGTFSHNWPTWEAVIAMISQESLKMEPMISHRITIDQWEETFKAIEESEGVKAVMQFNR
ncbi:MAG: alcohol dehydrogenase catalytic domain-containing protein [Chitinivibrionales bacterium]|nr:alcohol dehydrogenase catalytic domain-containing protein [Chitinivibrionales bacterium]MBD3396126.1 alcohol dehydrogenase catalytic domain-containing protein [Chitinivibrionales bacterium]